MESPLCRPAPLTEELVARAAYIIGAEGAVEEEIEKQLLALAGDEMLAKRLRHWIPEAFGRTIVLRLGEVRFENTFSARTVNGTWVQIPEALEPILPIATRLAHEMFCEPTLEIHQRISYLSATLSTVSDALHGGAPLDGAVMSGAFAGIPAEAYPDFSNPLWKQLFGK